MRAGNVRPIALHFIPDCKKYRALNGKIAHRCPVHIRVIGRRTASHGKAGNGLSLTRRESASRHLGEPVARPVGGRASQHSSAHAAPEEIARNTCGRRPARQRPHLNRAPRCPADTQMVHRGAAAGSQSAQKAPNERPRLSRTAQNNDFNGVFPMVLRERIELSASPLPRECSTTELPQRLGGPGPAGAGSRRALPV